MHQHWRQEHRDESKCDSTKNLQETGKNYVWNSTQLNELVASCAACVPSPDIWYSLRRSTTARPWRCWWGVVQGQAGRGEAEQAGYKILVSLN